MHKLRTYLPWLTATLLFCIIALFLFPHYGWYIDTDGVSYLTICRRYAEGDFWRAVNSYWSPWACWLTAGLMKQGLLAIPAGTIVNATGAVGVLFITQSFLLLLGIKRSWQWLLNVTMAFFLCYAIFKQSFDDLWECFFLLGSLRLMLTENYRSRPMLWLLNGITGALAYFAKAYAFPFFILNTICTGFLLTNGWERAQRLQWLKMSAVAIITMIVCSVPWMYVLHAKYGLWWTSSAGTLNTSWYLVGHPYYKEGITHLLPPPYTDSPVYWEEPWAVNGDLPHFWSSPKLFVLQVVRVGHNLLKLVNAMNEMSALYLAVWLVAMAIMLSKKVKDFFGDKARVVALSFLLFPLGFIIINYEARYIWYTLPLSMVLGAFALQKLFLVTPLPQRLRVFVISVFAASYLVYPVWDMKDMAIESRQGRADYITALTLVKEHGIHGNFAANINKGKEWRKAIRLAYFMRSSYYNMPYDAPFSDVVKDMRRHNVAYYFYFSTPGTVTDCAFADETGVALKQVAEIKEYGLKVFRLSR